MPTLIDTLRETFGAERLATDEATRLVYGYDNSRRESMPDAVVFPTSHEDVVALTRTLEGEQLFCAFNLSGKPVSLPLNGFQPLDGHGLEFKIKGDTLTLPAFGGYFGRKAA